MHWVGRILEISKNNLFNKICRYVSIQSLMIKTLSMFLWDETDIHPPSLPIKDNIVCQEKCLR